MGRLERKYLAHFIDVNIGELQTNYVRIGNYLESYAEELNPQIDQQRDICGNPVISVSGYQARSEVETFYADPSDALFDVVSSIANGRINDESCQTTKVDVLVDGDGEQIWAYRESCLIVPKSVGGDTSGVQIPFDIYCTGDRTYGTFDFQTKEFQTGSEPQPSSKIIPLTVSENGIYSISGGFAYNPITVNVPQSEGILAAKILGGSVSGVFTNQSVTFLRFNAFALNWNMTEVNIPACSVIGISAFFRCSALSAVSAPSCQVISNSAFNGLSNLTKAEFPMCSAIGYDAFKGCTRLSFASFASCVEISGGNGSGAFYSCSALKSVYFPICSKVGSYAFYGCRSLTSVDMPSCLSISGYAFNQCYSLTQISFPICTNIGYGAFYGASYLSMASFPSCTLVQSSAFAYCTRLSSVSFPLCQSIYSYGFAGCGFSDVYFPSCTSVGSGAFQGCLSLATASFPLCEKIAGSAFYNCQKLVSLYLTGSSVAELAASTAFSSTPIGGYSTYAGQYGSIYVPSSLLATYQASTNWAYFSSRMVGI